MAESSLVNPGYHHSLLEKTWIKESENNNSHKLYFMLQTSKRFSEKNNS